MPPAAKAATKKPAARPVRKPAAPALGALPEWNLADLYPAIDAPELKRDLERARRRMRRLRGGLQGQARGACGGRGRRREARRSGQALRGARRSARPADLVCEPRLCGQHDRSGARQILWRHAGAHHAASLHLLVLHARAQSHRGRRAGGARWRDPALGHYRPWIEDIRKEKPYQLEDRVEELFHEKSVTGAGAWNRLFDETLGALRFKVDGKPLAIEQTLT